MAQFDFDLHGYFRLRLENATEKEASVVTRQLGPIAAPVSGQPDLTVRFVDALPDGPDLQYIGLNDAAYTPDAFYVLKGKQKSRVKVMIPFEKIGQNAEIVCERGINNIPLLIPLLNLTMLSKGILPMHASAFTYQGQGALVTGWAKGGKTEILLAFMARGASYVGDEWIYLCPDGTKMLGIPEPIRVWDWHLNSLPNFRARLKRKDRIRLQSLGAFSRSMDWISGSGNGHVSAPVKLLQRVTPLVKRQMYVQFPPYSLFGKDNIRPSSTIDKVIFTASHNSQSITVAPYRAEEVAQRMVFSLLEEQAPLSTYYFKYRFAFPDKANYWIEHAQRIQSKMLQKALEGKQTIAVHHPYPVQIPSLFDALRSYFD
jgi:hypothetical protein